MKNLKLIIIGIIIFTISSPLNAQSAFRKKYFVKGSITYYEYKDQKFIENKTRKTCDNIKISDTLHLMVVNNATQKKIDTIIKIVEKQKFDTEGNKIKYEDTIITKKITRINKKDTAFFFSGEFRANVKFENNKVWINPWLYKTNFSTPTVLTNRESQIYYQLVNRRQLRIRYRQWTVSPITIPLKVQFGNDNVTKFAAGISLGGFGGHSWGWTKFTHRNKIENFERSHEITVGGLFSFQGIEIDLGNENTRETVATSIGIGITYSYDKINFGLTGGLDYAHGFGADKWTFQGRPWLGIVFGYSLFD
ncbi:hypothetical protein [Crocinitomix catalasitica]|uniref:hypothetical protein n=1 Tax=Crocinitomix catalasitica TaxID=184607 RepID=UPI000482B791|nr:hypothetical protein [Crocinitomix catalasitica]